MQLNYQCVGDSPQSRYALKLPVLNFKLYITPLYSLLPLHFVSVSFIFLHEMSSFLRVLLTCAKLNSYVLSHSI